MGEGRRPRGRSGGDVNRGDDLEGGAQLAYIRIFIYAIGHTCTWVCTRALRAPPRVVNLWRQRPKHTKEGAVLAKRCHWCTHTPH